MSRKAETARETEALKKNCLQAPSLLRFHTCIYADILQKYSGGGGGGGGLAGAGGWVLVELPV